MSTELNLTLKIWRQAGPDAPGQFVTIPAPYRSPPCHPSTGPAAVTA